MPNSFFHLVGIDIPKQSKKGREISLNNTFIPDKSENKLSKLSKKFLKIDFESSDSSRQSVYSQVPYPLYSI